MQGWRHLCQEMLCSSATAFDVAARQQHQYDKRGAEATS
jgi:hypothetical protein